MPDLLWIMLALALLPCGWFAAACYYKPKLRAWQDQVQAIRHMAAEHAHQARRQIGQLQAELATRPPLPSPERDLPAVAAAATGEAQGVARAHAESERGFATTAILSDGFPQTILVRPPPRR